MTAGPLGPKGWTPERLGTPLGKTCLVTGANAGAGFQAARILLSKGAAVVMLNRGEEKPAVAAGAMREKFGADAEVRFLRMDLAELGSACADAEEVLASTPPGSMC